MEIDGDQDERAPCTLLTEGDQNQEKDSPSVSHTNTGRQRAPGPKLAKQHELPDLLTHHIICEPTQLTKGTRNSSIIKLVMLAQH